LSVPDGTIGRTPRRVPRTEPLRSYTGVPLRREVTFKFALEPTRDQQRQLLAHAGAARLAFNHHLARVKINMTRVGPNQTSTVGPNGVVILTTSTSG
jgi:putative transposase